MASLQGRHALVTGGGRGIGRAIAAALTEAGAAVTITGRNEKALADVVGQGEAAGYVIADVTDAKAVDSGVKQAVAARGPIDLLIANAGTAAAAPFVKTTPDQFRAMFDVHVLGMLHPLQAVLGGMTERGFGRVVAIASIVGLKASPNVSAYTTAKHAMVGLVRSVAIETAGTGVTVNAVCPGVTKTLLNDELFAARSQQLGVSEEKLRSDAINRIPMKTIATPDQIAPAVVFLASEGAARITGEAVNVSAGAVMH